MTTETDAATAKRQQANALRSLAADLRDADSIAEDVPALAELFHEVRTSSRRARDGRYVGLFDLDRETGEWSCRSVAFLESGTHYRDTGADAIVAHNPWPFCTVDTFGERVAPDLERKATAAEQNAIEMERSL